VPFSDHARSDTSAGNPLIVAPLFLATLTLTGVVYGELRLMTGSVWPAALAHGAGNSFWSTFTGLTVTTSPLALEYLAGESGVLPLLGLVVVAGWVLYHLGQEPRTAQQTIAPPVEANA
jgi:membrane protease YdiL (CAAX protease family)